MRFINLVKTLGKIILLIIFLIILLFGVISYSAYRVTTPQKVIPLLIFSLEKDENLTQAINQLYSESKNYFDQNPQQEKFVKNIQNNNITITKNDVLLGEEVFRKETIKKWAQEFYYKKRESSDIGNIFSYSGNKLFLLITLASWGICLGLVWGIIFSFKSWRRLTVLGFCFLIIGLFWLPFSMFKEQKSSDFYDLIFLNFAQTFKRSFFILFVLGLSLIGLRIILPPILKITKKKSI